MTEKKGLGLERRIKYLIDRAAKIDVSRVWSIASQISAATKKPTPLIFCDMLYSSVRYEMAFQNYQDWDFYDLNRAERSTFMSDPKSNHLSLKLNHPELRLKLANKTAFNKEFADFIGREWLDIRESSAAQLAEFIKKHGEVIIKVPDSLGGLGVTKYTYSEGTDFGELYKTLIAGRQFLVEQLITQHQEIAMLCPTSVNTIRIISYFNGTETKIIAQVLKIGNGGPIDNFSSGGMYTMLDERGVVFSPAFDGHNKAYEIHPYSGVKIVGFQVPMFHEILDLVKKISRIIPEVPYVGWDIAVTPAGPVVIEGNYNTGVFQAKPTVSGVRTGLLPKYREAIGF